MRQPDCERADKNCPTIACRMNGQCEATTLTPSRPTGFSQQQVAADNDARQFLATTTGDVHTSWIITGLEACIKVAEELVGNDGKDADNMRDPDNWSGPDNEFFCWHRGYEDGSLTFQRIMTAPTVAPPPATPSPATVDVGEGASQGLCETTSTERFAFANCDCETYAGNLGPCRDYADNGVGRCVYCDHGARCHIRSLASALETAKKEVADLKTAFVLRQEAELRTLDHADGCLARATAAQAALETEQAKVKSLEAACAAQSGSTMREFLARNAAEALAREAGEALQGMVDTIVTLDDILKGRIPPRIDAARLTEIGEAAKAVLAQLRPVTTEGK